MGSFLSIVKPKVNQETLPDLNINLEDSVPTPDETAFYEQIHNSTRNLDELLLLMRNYKGCSQLIRKAISEPTEENETACWEALQKPVHTIIKLYEICQTLEEKVPEIFDYLCSGTIPVHTNMKRNPSIAQFIVRFFSFASEFDNLKVATPDFQNDFSYYRRLLSKFHMNNNSQYKNVTSIISDDQANRLSMFFAYPNPAIKTVINSIVKFANQTKPALKQNVLDFLLGIVSVAYYAITKDRIKHAVTLDAMFYTMITCTVIYDHVHPFGVFNKPSEIDIKLVLKSIDAHAGPLKPKLLSSLQYNSQHLNDPTTPQNIRSHIKA